MCYHFHECDNTSWLLFALGQETEGSDVMLRTQIQLTEAQARTLKRLARQKQVSLAELIRQSVDLYIAVEGKRPLDEQYARALAVAGKYQSGDADLGRNHDDYLADAYATSSEPTGE